MKTNACSALVLGVVMCTATSAAAQGAVGAVAIDERQDDQYGWGADPGGPDGMFGTRTGSATRSWQRSRGERTTSHLEVASMAALRLSVAEQPMLSARSATAPAVPTAQQQSPAASAEVELVFWQSIADSTNPAEFEAYLRRFPNGMFRDLAQIRLEAVRAGSNAGPASAARRAADVDAPRHVGDVFRDCPDCPEMVVLAGGTLAMGRYEVTVGEYRAFVSATGGGGGGGGCATALDRGDSWRNPGYSQTDRHPVGCMSWEDAQEYVSWLSQRTGAPYRLPTEAEWERAAAGSPTGCGDRARAFYLDNSGEGTCEAGTNGTNAAGLSDMVGNVWEWTSGCWEGDCGRRVMRGGSWVNPARSPFLQPVAREPALAGVRSVLFGFRVSRTLD